MYDELIGDLYLVASGVQSKNRRELLEQAADAIEELIAKDINVPSKWIPVEERPPKYGDWVLGIGPKHGYHVCEYRGITHFPYSGDSPWFCAKGRTVTITHWMPLPEPPKEET